ncbi:unnamed protein product [Rotaria sp. Silwood2]|nr:unnamed protein product [Rotaria sp. Silwood2]CAF3187630.1 unnamed protein product [Rotaria sp. Silwood2]CAF3983964.1 unnamed protein product [Rotaria sp. Silwood2]CAF4142436.1 unnamed protein product [Rotaria sp. Silwood2]CAF4364586.1 unnamed protein product [Rotaria sp. Silwood2]
MITSWFPLPLMITFTTLAYKNLRRVQGRVQPVINMRNNVNVVRTGIRRRIQSSDIQLLKMLIVETTTYCVSMISYPIYIIYAAVTLNKMKSGEQQNIENFVAYVVTLFLPWIEASSTLYTNMIISKLFRHEVKLLLIDKVLRPIVQVLSRLIENHGDRNRTTVMTITGDARRYRVGGTSLRIRMVPTELLR